MSDSRQKPPEDSDRQQSSISSTTGAPPAKSGEQKVAAPTPASGASLARSTGQQSTASNSTTRAPAAKPVSPQSAGATATNGASSARRTSQQSAGATSNSGVPSARRDGQQPPASTTASGAPARPSSQHPTASASAASTSASGTPLARPSGQQSTTPEPTNRAPSSRRSGQPPAASTSNSGAPAANRAGPQATTSTSAGEAPVARRTGQQSDASAYTSEAPSSLAQDRSKPASRNSAAKVSTNRAAPDPNQDRSSKVSTQQATAQKPAPTPTSGRANSSATSSGQQRGQDQTHGSAPKTGHQASITPSSFNGYLPGQPYAKPQPSDLKKYPAPAMAPAPQGFIDESRVSLIPALKGEHESHWKDLGGQGILAMCYGGIPEQDSPALPTEGKPSQVIDFLDSKLYGNPFDYLKDFFKRNQSTANAARKTGGAEKAAAEDIEKFLGDITALACVMRSFNGTTKEWNIPWYFKAPQRVKREVAQIKSLVGWKGWVPEAAVLLVFLETPVDQGGVGAVYHDNRGRGPPGDCSQKNSHAFRVSLARQCSDVHAKYLAKFNAELKEGKERQYEQSRWTVTGDYPGEREYTLPF